MPMPGMPEPIRSTKIETFNGVEMETVYRQGKTPVDPRSENRDAGGPGMNSMGMGVCPDLNPSANRTLKFRSAMALTFISIFSVRKIKLVFPQSFPGASMENAPAKE